MGNRSKAVVAVLVAALAVYLILIGWRGIYLLGQPKLVLKLFGVGVLILPIIGIWVVIAELRFGRDTQRLATDLGTSDEPEDLPRRPSGRIDRRAADALFDRRRAEVEASPDDWRGWYQLAVAYDLAGDRRRARSAMRTAIARHDAPVNDSGHDVSGTE